LADYQTRVGETIVATYIRAAKKIYLAPAFEVIDISVAKAKLVAQTTSKNEDSTRMMSLVDRLLGTIKTGARFSRDDSDFPK
jgi:hypothetical protein